MRYFSRGEFSANIFESPFVCSGSFNLPKMFCIVDLKSLGSIPRITERLDTSEQLEMTDNFLCMSDDNFRPCEIFLCILLWNRSNSVKKRQPQIILCFTLIHLNQVVIIVDLGAMTVWFTPAAKWLFYVPRKFCTR